jgi:hypothetical protein
MSKLPKPQWLGDIPGYSKAQMLQFRHDTLEEAARECQDMKQECGEPDSMQACLNRQMMSCADAIYKLKDEI